MKTIGIIAEYNPFHNGHLLQLKRIREKFPDARIVIAMSGNFTQRGTPAIADKWTRALQAIKGGANLILELPFAFATRSAQPFARGGVSLLAKIGVIDMLAFGAESPDAALLQRIAECAQTGEFQKILHEKLSLGLSYAAAFEETAAIFCNLPPLLLRQPNNILAVEYLRALATHAPAMQILPIRREGVAHKDTALRGKIASATAIRNALCDFQKSNAASLPEHLLKTVPAHTANDLTHLHQIPTLEIFYKEILWALKRTPAEALHRVEGISEGIEQRILYATEKSHSLEELCQIVATRRYPRTRLQRLFLHLLIDFRKEHAARFDESGVLYARPLAFDAAGQTILQEIKQKSTLPIITKLSKSLSDKARKSSFTELSPMQQMLAFDAWGTELWVLCSNDSHDNTNDFTKSPVIWKGTST